MTNKKRKKKLLGAIRAFSFGKEKYEEKK